MPLNQLPLIGPLARSLPGHYRFTPSVDANVFVRHLTGDPPEQAAPASRYLAAASELRLEDLIIAEVAYVLESVYRAPRTAIALSLRGILGFPTIRAADPELLQRTVEI